MTAGNWQSSSNIIRKVLMMKIHLCIVASVAILILPFAAKGEYKMPMLKWAGKEKVVNHHNDVPFRVLERKCLPEENRQYSPRNRFLEAFIY